MDNEKYEATIDLNILPFEQKIKRVTKLYDSFIAEAKKSKWINDKFFYIDKTKDQTAQIEEMWAKMREFASGSEGALGGNALVNTAIPEIMEETANIMETLGENTEETAQATNELNISVKHTKNTFVGFTPSIKKMALALLGVRTGFSLFRRAMNEAMASNEVLAEKFNTIWRGLGNALAPLLERIINLILRAFSYLSIFIKALSGGKIDLLAKTSASAKSTAGSLKEANKYLAGFDELNNVEEQSSSGGGISGGVDPLANIGLDDEKVSKLQSLGDKVRTVWENIKYAISECWKSAKDNWNAMIKVISDKAIAFKDWLIEKWNNIKYAVGEIWNSVKDNFEAMKQRLSEGAQAIHDWFVEKWNNIKYAVTECWKSVSDNWDALKQRISDGVTAIKDWFVEKWNTIKTTVVDIWTNIKTKWDETKSRVSDGVASLKNSFVEKWEAIKNKWIEVKNGIVTAWDNLKTKVSETVDKIKTKIQDIKDDFKEKVNSIIGFVESGINKMISGINSLIRSINRISFTTPDWIPLIGGKSFGFNIGQLNSIVLPRLDTGTNYVPSDQLAMIHKGEAVVPKKFNSGEFFGGSEELADKLDVLIDVVNNIDLNPYITVKDVGEASVKYQNQQYRLRGRSLVNG